MLELLLILKSVFKKVINAALGHKPGSSGQVGMPVYRRAGCRAVEAREQEP